MVHMKQQTHNLVFKAAPNPLRTFFHQYVSVCTCMYKYLCKHIYMYTYLYCICSYICICKYTYMDKKEMHLLLKSIFTFKPDETKVHVLKINVFLGRPEGLSVLELCCFFFVGGHVYCSLFVYPRPFLTAKSSNAARPLRTAFTRTWQLTYTITSITLMSFVVRS